MSDTVTQGGKVGAVEKDNGIHVFAFEEVCVEKMAGNDFRSRVWCHCSFLVKLDRFVVW